MPVINNLLTLTLTQDEIRATLKKIGIKKGDALLVHSSLFAIGNIEGVRLDKGWLDLLQESVGDSGALVFPSFTYSYCKGDIYDPHKSLSRVSTLANYCIVKHIGYRTLDPLFSYVIVTKRAVDYMFSNICFDIDGGILGYLQNFNSVKAIELGVRTNFTFLHSADQELNVNYRFLKRFDGITCIDGAEHKNFCYYFCRLLVKNTQRVPCVHNGVLREKLGNGFIFYNDLKTIYSRYKQDMAENPYIYALGPELADDEIASLRAREMVELNIKRIYSKAVKL